MPQYDQRGEFVTLITKKIFFYVNPGMIQNKHSKTAMLTEASPVNIFILAVDKMTCSEKPTESYHPIYSGY